MMSRRIIGVDFGTKRVGLAVSDPFGWFAQTDGTYDQEGAIRRIDELHRTLGVGVIVVGWPLTLEGEEGEAVAFVRPFVERLKRTYPDVEIVTWDERYTSERARQALIEAGVRRKHRRKKGRIDTAAAALILQEYLEHRRLG